MGIPIRYNGFAGRQMVIGAIVGVIAGLLSYSFASAPVDSYGSDPRGDTALMIGFATAFLVAAVADVVDRVISGTRRRHGAAAALAPDSGGHIWYVPMWIVGALVGALFASH